MIKYINDELTGVELNDFLKSLAEDPAFAAEVAMAQKIKIGLVNNYKRKVNIAVDESLNFKKRAMPFELKLTMGFIIFTLIGITLWTFIDNKTAHRYLRVPLIKRSQVALKAAPSATDENSVLPPLTEARVVIDSNRTDSVSLILPIDTLAINAEDEVIKKDQLLISAQLPLIVLKDEASLASHTATLLGEEASLPDMSDAKQLVVEFWINPLHYKGYKWSGEKLIIFGVENPDEVSLVNLNNCVWMNWRGKYYRLPQTEVYTTYQAETNIPIDKNLIR
jgi:hypothetical protein